MLPFGHTRGPFFPDLHRFLTVKRPTVLPKRGVPRPFQTIFFRQVFWLPVQSPAGLPVDKTIDSGVSTFVSGYSGGPAPEFNGIPFSLFL